MPIETSQGSPATYYVKKPETAINYVDTDQFCLDGSPLVLVSQSPGEGAEYRTEQDSGVRVFMRMNGTAANTLGPDHFDVYSPDGHVSQYGGLPQVKGFESTGYETWSATGTYGDGVSPGVRSLWAVNHIQDLQGNTIDYVYVLTGSAEVSPGQEQTHPVTHQQMTSVQGTRPLIEYIFYGGSASYSANREIMFFYQSLASASSLASNQRFGWMSGNPYAFESRLTAIGTYFEEKEIRKYMLQYDSDTRRNRLSSLYECAQESCKQPTNFTYKTAPGAGDAGPALDVTAVAFPKYADIDAIQAVLDVNGDGLPDLVLNPNLDTNSPVDCDAHFSLALATGDRTNPYSLIDMPSGASTCHKVSTQQGTELVPSCLNAADLDADGKAEIYNEEVDSNGAAHTHQFIYEKTTKSWADSVSSLGNPCTSMADFNGDGFITSRPGKFILAIDTDGDGIPNTIQTNGTDNIVVPVGGTGTPAPKYYIANEYEDWTIYTPPGQPGAGTVKQENPVTFHLGMPVPVGADSAASQDSYIRAHMNGSSGQPFIVANWSTGLKVVDVNGDGLKDLFSWTASAPASTGTYQTGTGPSSYLLLWTNTGRNQFTNGVPVSSLISSADQTILDAVLNAGTFQQAFPYDINRDGLEDLVFPNINSWVTALISVPNATTGAKFRLQQVVQTPSWFQKLEPGKGRVIPLDVDGDGVTDLVMGSGYNVYVMFQHGAEHDLLDTVTDGNGKKQSITYVSGKATGVYTDSLPQTSVSKPAHILPPTVASITTDKADGLQLVESYKYTDARVGYYGRSLLGFTEVDKTVSGSDVGVVSDESTFYHPDSLKEVNIGAQTSPYKMYFEAGRPWKHVVAKHGITSGLGKAAKVIDNVITETRTLQLINSSANVPMWLPYTDAITESEVDAAHSEQALTTTSKTYTFDQYGMLTSMSSSTTGPSGQALQSQSTSTSYKRDQSFLDKNLIGLPVSVTTQINVAGDVVTHNEDRDYYDSGLLEHVTTESDDSSLSIKTEYPFYNSRGNPSSMIQSGGGMQRESDFYYDASGDYVETTLNPLLQTTTYSYYRGYGQLALMQDANGLVSSRSIDVFGRDTGTTDANQNVVVTSYEVPGPDANFLTNKGRSIAYAVRKRNFGASQSVWQSVSQSVTYYDSCGHEIGATTSDADAFAPLHRQNYYDSLGRKTYRSHTPFYDNGPSEQQDHILYDNLNRPTSITLATDATPTKQTTYTMSYGHASDVVPAGQLSGGVRAVTTTYPNQSTQTMILDSQGRTLGMFDRNGRFVSYTYGATGGILTFTDQAGLTVQKHYDRYGRTTSTQDPIRGSTQTQYTPLGDTVQENTPLDYMVTEYDALNRPVTEDALGRLTSWTYDNEPGAIGRLVQVATSPKSTIPVPQGNVVHYTYGQNTDTAGNRGKLRKSQSSIGTETFSIDYDYDQNERLSTTHFPAMSNGQRYAVTNQYTNAGRLKAVVEADGGQGRTLWQVKDFDSVGRNKNVQALGAMSTSYNYTDIDGLISQITASESGQERVNLSYAFDVEHNVTSIGWRENGQFSPKSRSYQYDASGRFTDEFSGILVSGTMKQGDLIDHVDYLPNGNIDGKSDVGQYTYGETAFGNPYAVTAVGSNTYEYDSYGRVTKRTAPYIPSGQQTLTWTTFDAISTIADANQVQTSYDYNGLKERVLETNSTQRKYRVGGIYQRTDDLASGNRLHSLQVNAGGSLVAEVQFTDDGKGTVGSPNVYSMLSDRMGSVAAVRDPSGSYVTRNYDAFGNASGNTLLSSSVGYAGYQQDDGLALLLMSNRPYDPAIGRALTLDPIINGGAGQDGANRYAYAYNRPTAFVDPSGFCSISIQTPFGTWTLCSGGGGGSSSGANPTTWLHGTGKTGILVNEIMASHDDPALDYGSRAVNQANDNYVNSLVPTTSGEIATDSMEVVTDKQTGTSGDAASGNARGTAAGGDGTGDGTSSASQRSDPLDLFPSPPADSPAPPRAVRAWVEGGSTVILYDDGTIEVRSPTKLSTLAWQNNNPGNLRGSPDQVGSAFGFAVFGSEAEGEAALRSLLNNAPYVDMSVNDAIARYAPAFENDTAAYQTNVQQAIGVSGTTPISQLTNNQFDALVNKIGEVEGWVPGKVTRR